MRTSDKKAIARVLAKRGIEILSDWRILSHGHMPVAEGVKGRDHPVLLQFNGFDSVFIYDLKDQAFFQPE